MRDEQYSAGVWQNCICFDFNPPFGVEHLGDDHGGRRADAAEYLSVRPSNFLPVFGVGYEHAGTHHVLEFGSRLMERLLDERKDMTCLLIGRKVVRANWASPGN